MMAAAYYPSSAGADERTLIRAVEKLIGDVRQLSQENQALKESIKALEGKVRKLEGEVKEAKETRSSMSSPSSENEKGLLARIKVFFVGSDSGEKSKESAGTQNVSVQQQPEKNSALNQQQSGEEIETKQKASVVDPMSLFLNPKKPKDCSSVGDGEQGTSPVKSKPESLNGCGG